MLGMQTLDIGLGLVFVYFVLSMICTAANEMVSAILKLRAETLVKGIENLLKDQGIANLERNFYQHPLIKSLCRGEKKPSYIPSRTFALTLLDLIAPARVNAFRYLSDVREAVSRLPDKSELKNTLLIFLDEAENDIQKLKKNMETWFNDAMDRVSGWYKRKVQFFIMVLAATIAVVSNADTLQIVKTLSNDPVLRQEFSKQVQEFAKQQGAAVSPGPPRTRQETPPAHQGKDPALQETKEQKEKMEAPALEQGLKRLQEIQAFGIPLGWKEIPREGKDWFNKIMGLLLTALAISLGAPFWFDLLNKIVSLRSVGISPEEKEEKAMKLQKESTSK